MDDRERRRRAGGVAEVRVRQSPGATAAMPSDVASVASIELVIDDVTVRVRVGVDLELLSAVIGGVSRCRGADSAPLIRSSRQGAIRAREPG